MIYTNGKLLLLAGPSLLEGEKVVFSVAEALKKLADKYADKLTVVFRGSFDKPLRSSLYSARGVGLNDGLKLLADVKDRFSLLVGTDIHERHQVEAASAVCDMLQIPSQLCRHTDLITDVAKSGCAINLRKGVQMSPAEALTLIEKVECAHANEIFLTECGSAFGYGNRVADMRVFPFLKRADSPVIFDAGVCSASPVPLVGGKMPDVMAFALPLSKAALAAGADGLYLDVHPEPENALIDNAVQLPLRELERFVEEVLAR